MKLKQIPEDFIVNEVLDLKMETGPYYYYRLTKRNWNTLDVIREIKRRLRVSDVGYAGIKDRNAVTSQYISVPRKISVYLKDVACVFVGTGKDRIHLGQHQGNEFVITIRDLEKKLTPVRTIINFFGEQRFSKKNTPVGKLLVTGKFREACHELGLDVIRNDYIGALRSIGKETLRLYVNAYQSALWNTLAKKSTKKVVPILGYLTKGHAYDRIMKKEGIRKEDFQLRSLPEIAAEGGERPRVVSIKRFKTRAFEDDELNHRKKKQTISFFLPRGAYATVAIKKLLK